MRPVLYVDVDDVLNLCVHGRHDPWKCRCHTAWAHTWARIPGHTDPLPLCLNPTHGPQLLQLAEGGGADLTWCTSWGDLANEHIAPALGLPHLPVCPYPPRPPRGRPGHRTDLGVWKARHAVADAAGRPFVLLENEPAAGWECHRLLGDAPHKVVQVNPRHGLTDADVAEAAEALTGFSHSCP
jgi:hypothetical protein